MAKLFRGKFRAALIEALGTGAVELPPDSPPDVLDRLRAALYATDWLVYAKAPFGGAEQVHSYIGRYTHRVGIANSRIQSMDERGVTFATKNGGVETVSVVEFLRRFAEHVLPKGFTRIRHYGLLAPSHATTTLERARALIPVDAAVSAQRTAAPPSDPSTGPGAHASTWIDLLRELTGEDAERCPRCGTGRLVRHAPDHGPAPPRRDTS